MHGKRSRPTGRAALLIIMGLRAGIQLVGTDCFNYTLHENGSGLGPSERKYASDTWRTAVRYYAGPGAGPKGEALTYVIGEPCIDVLDRACVEECPVDCIYEGARSLYIHPDECVDCGACEPVCPVEAIYYEDDLPASLEPYRDDNARFFAKPLPGRDEALGSPGGAGKAGVTGADTELVASHSKRETVS